VLRGAVAAAASTLVTKHAAAMHPLARRRATDPDRDALAERAVDAARSAGATYADARLTITRRETPGLQDSEERAIGVRALVNGYWGFAASAVWTPDEAARLAREAATQAAAHSRGGTRAVELGPPPTVRRGEWVMPVKYDPFDVSAWEKIDVMNAFASAVSDYRNGLSSNYSMNFMRQSSVFASTDGASWAQTIYQSAASFTLMYPDEYHAGLGMGAAAANGLSPAGRGWELVSESNIVDAIPALAVEAELSRHLVPFDIGRYDVVFSAEAMASLLDQTLAPAMELDRALGYEANASGTSFLDAPLDMLGAQVVASPLITVTGNRSTPGGLATVRWDDEGIVPDDFTLVKDGVLVDYQTTREQAAWLAPYYQRTGRAVRSHGCAAGASGLVIPMQHAPNLALAPGAARTTFDDLVAGTEKGIAVLSLNANMDQQQLNGIGYGTMREIVRGKLGRYISGGAFMFRTPEFWKSVIAVGGPGTQQWFGRGHGKGEPRQSTWHSVAGIPAKVRQLSFVDPGRKA